MTQGIRWTSVVVATMALAGCNTTESIDAAAGRDAWSAEDGGPGADAPRAEDAGPSGGCPSVAGSYTWLDSPSPTCDVTTAKNTYPIELVQAAGSCTVSLSSLDTSDNRWPLMGTVTIDETGSFTDATLHIATSDTTCDGTYVPASGADPARYDVVCLGACMWSIGLGG
ncbi:MAG: hypothetical protein U0353_17185 [Sandaracinus sp.]